MKQVTITISIEEARMILTGLQEKMNAERRLILHCEEVGKLAESIRWNAAYHKTDLLYEKVCDQIIPQEVNA